MRIMQNRKDFVTKHGKRFTNMYLPWHMEQETMFFIMGIGSENPVLRYAAVMMD